MTLSHILFRASRTSFLSSSSSKAVKCTQLKALFFSDIPESLLSYQKGNGLKAKGVLNYFPAAFFLAGFLAFSVLYFEVSWWGWEGCSTGFCILLPAERSL